MRKKKKKGKCQFVALILKVEICEEKKKLKFHKYCDIITITLYCAIILENML